MADAQLQLDDDGGLLREDTVASSLRRKRSLPAKYLNDWDRYPPVQRSAWWQQDIKGYPDVGQYSPKEAYRIQALSYPCSAFKTSGRARQTVQVPSGQLLLPGAYNHQDFLYTLNKGQQSYGFKNSSKSSQEVLTEGLLDRQLKHLSPGQYNVENFRSIRADKEPVRSSVFKSRSRRVIAEFEPREGPEPGRYEHQTTLSPHGTRTSFVSRSPRFSSSHNKVPAPGSYGKSYQSPMPANLTKLGRQHGLFFSAAFYS